MTDDTTREQRLRAERAEAEVARLHTWEGIIELIGEYADNCAKEWAETANSELRAELQRLRTERDCINGERMTFLTQRDQLRALIVEAGLETYVPDGSERVAAHLTEQQRIIGADQQ